MRTLYSSLGRPGPSPKSCRGKMCGVVIPSLVSRQTMRGIYSPYLLSVIYLNNSLTDSLSESANSA